MRRYSLSAILLITITAAVALLITAWAIWHEGLPARDLPAATLLGILSAIALLSPVKSAREQSSYALGNIFSFAAILVLPPSWTCLLCFVTWLPSLLGRYRASRPPKPDFWVAPLFNASQLAVLSYAAYGVLRLTHSTQLTGLTSVLWLGVAVLLFVSGQTLFVSLMISFYRRVPLRTVDTLHVESLASDLYQPFLGAIWAVLWRVHPALLLLGLVPMVLAYRGLRNVQLVRLAELDPKTGLYNYRYFEEQLRGEVPRAVRLRRPLSLVFADLDYLRTINNTHGHQVGDDALIQVAGVFLDQGAKYGTPARFGGEEFVLILPGVDREEAAFVAERMRRRIEQLQIPLPDGGALSVTMSFGVAVCPEDGATTEALVKAADDAVYRAKAAGRNCVVQAEGQAACLGQEQASAQPPAQPPKARPSYSARGAVAASAQASATSPATAPQPPAANRPAAMDPVVTTLVAAVTLAGLGLVAWAVGVIAPDQWTTLAIIALLAGGAQIIRVDVPTKDGPPKSVSVAMVVIMATSAALGMAPAILVSLLPSLVQAITSPKRELHKVVFNFGMMAISATVSSLPFLIPGFSAGGGALSVPGLLALGLAAVLYYVANIGLVVGLMSVTDRRPVLELWRSGIAWLTPYYLTLVLTGGLIGSLAEVLGWIGSGALVVLLLLIWKTLTVQTAGLRTSTQASEHAEVLLEQLRRSAKADKRSATQMASAIIQVRDRLVHGHSEQVAAYAQAIAQEVGIQDAASLEQIRSAAMLHDLGKLGLPESLLNKSERLTSGEFERIKTHVAIGEQILKEIQSGADLAVLVGKHKERWDGSGYPRGLRREETPLGARVLAVADALEAMLSEKPYAPGRSLRAALAELERCAGTQFDPAVVQAVQRLAQRTPNLFVRNTLPPGEKNEQQQADACATQP